MHLSVIICCHNPRTDYLVRVFDGLKAQTLSHNEWELLLIDNASDEPLSRQYDLSWHPKSQHIREDAIGLTPARLRGIREAQTEILVFVDDDNVLAPNYLLECIRISEKWPCLGAWGGQQFPEFEGGEPTEKWKQAFWTAAVERDVWSNNYDRSAAPIGAGICIRRVVARKYAESVAPNSLRGRLGRSGSGMNSSEDIDMAFTACDVSLGIGRFVSLRLMHLIPRQRLTDEYLFRLIEGISYSETIVIALRGEIPARRSRVDRLVDFYKGLRITKTQRWMARAAAEGRTRALNDLDDSQMFLA